MATTEVGLKGGGDGSRSGDFIAVRVMPVAVGVAILTGLFLLVAYMSAPLPHFVARVFGVKQGLLARQGGLFLTWSPPPGFDDTRLDRVEHALRARAAATGGEVTRDGATFRIAMAGILRAEVDSAIARIVGAPSKPGSDPHAYEGLAFREVLQDDAMKHLPDFEPQLSERDASPSFEIDQWRADDSPSQPVIDYYVQAPTRTDLERLFSDARSRGWRLPDGAMIAYEHVVPEQRPAFYRSYLVRAEAELDGSYIADAVTSYDPNTNRPTVLLDFDRDGAQKFGDLTARIVGRKLALMVNGEIRSAPIINGPIRGGRAAIAMGGGFQTEQERDARQLAELLREGGALPPGGRVTESHYIPPTHDTGREWLARLLLALVGGVFIGGLTRLVVGWVGPVRRTRQSRFAGPLPWTRIIATLAAPASILIVSRIPIYGVNLRDDGTFLGMFHDTPELRIGALGIMPVITAAIIVELVALAIPGWRRRRHAGPVARFPITLAAAVTAVLLIMIQGWSVAQYLGSVEGTMAPGLMPKILVVASVAGGTLILIAGAAIVRMFGLGNGYGALFVFGWLIASAHQLHGTHLVSGDHALGALTVILIAATFAVILRWRVQRSGELGLRLPVSSVTPLTEAATLLAFVALVAQFSFEEVMVKVADWMSHVREHPVLLIALVMVLAILWSFALGRPSRYAGLERPSWAVWTRATVLSVLALTFVAAVVALTLSLHVGIAWLVQPISIALAVGYGLDAYEDLLARRSKLVVVWTLHQPHHIDAAQAVLADAGIAAHMSASNMRTLLAFFGPFIPIEVMVAPDQAIAAREKLEALVV